MRKLSKGEMKFMVQDLLSLKVGKNLKSIIKRKGYTQKQFAEQMNVDPTTVRRWLGRGIKDVDTIFAIAKFLDIALTDILK